MITRCDHCGSTFEVSAELLNSGDPSVRCGECMSLFDARANLYDEADFLRASENLKPVRKNRVGDHQAETVDSEYLETAETLAVEHVYTAAGVVASTSNRTRGSTAAPTPPDFDGQPDIDLARRSDRHREHRVDNIYPQDLEFERTVATESVHVNINPDAGYRDGARSRRDYHDDSRSRDSHRDNTVTRREAQHRQQATREREQRALQLEPERDYKSQTIVEGQGSRADAARSADQQQLRQVDHSRAVNKSAESKDRNRSRADHKPIDESDLVDDAGNYARGNHAFIPDDVLKKSVVHRDDGRRDDNLQFRSDTPRFATSPRDRRSRGSRSEGNGTRASTADTFANTQVKRSDDYMHDRARSEGRRTDRAVREQTRHDHEARHIRDARRTDKARHDNDTRTSAGSGVRPETGNSETARSHREPEARRDAENRPYSDRSDDLRSSEFQHLHDRDFDELAVRDSRLEVAGSSAQEMRRYQHYRPSVDVAVADDVTEEPAARTGRALSIRPVLWFIGLCAVICMLLFAARNVIANMNLPEPLMTGFCQVTGCVPAEAKKDVSQLQTMRKTLFPHPEIEDALVISVDVVNNSVYKQPYPTLAVTLLDAEGGTIAERAFDNADYEVVDGGENGFLMPGNPTRLKIEVVDTGLDANELELAFE